MKRPAYEEVLALGAALTSVGAVNFAAVVSSSRRMGSSSGASTPIRTMPGAMRTTVMEILSPIRIFSPGFRDRTSIHFTRSRPANPPGMVEKGQSAASTHHDHDNPFNGVMQAPVRPGKRICRFANQRTSLHANTSGWNWQRPLPCSPKSRENWQELPFTRVLLGRLKNQIGDWKNNSQTIMIRLSHVF